jgi:hypothetical protein
VSAILVFAKGIVSFLFLFFFFLGGGGGGGVVGLTKQILHLNVSPPIWF